jgi:hypothetical protein
LRLRHGQGDNHRHMNLCKTTFVTTPHLTLPNQTKRMLDIT